MSVFQLKKNLKMKKVLGFYSSDDDDDDEQTNEFILRYVIITPFLQLTNDLFLLETNKEYLNSFYNHLNLA